MRFNSISFHFISSKLNASPNYVIETCKPSFCIKKVYICPRILRSTAHSSEEKRTKKRQVYFVYYSLYWQSQATVYGCCAYVCLVCLVCLIHLSHFSEEIPFIGELLLGMKQNSFYPATAYPLLHFALLITAHTTSSFLCSFPVKILLNSFLGMWEKN